MSGAESTRELRRKQHDFTAKLLELGWYHSFELPDGTAIQGYMALDWERKRWSRFPIPEDLSGKRLLDVGAWDGWFSFEAERRGAEVTSIDYTEQPNYLWLHRKLKSKAVYRNLDLFELPWTDIGRFDIVLCLGVLYHLRHPFWGIEILCGLATELVILETFVTDGATWEERRDEIPTMEFYETDELNRQFDNWNGPTVGCLLAMCRAAGFARVEPLAIDAENMVVACWRKWEPEPEEPTREAPELLHAVNNLTFGINFYTRRDEYVKCWFHAEGSVAIEELRLEVGEFGAHAIALRREPEGHYIANFRLPPGLPAGWTRARLRLAGSRFSAGRRIAIDMPVKAERLAVEGVKDNASWQPNEAPRGGYVCCWVAGLPENADCSNVRLFLGDERLAVTFLGDPDHKGQRQVNARIPESCAAGAQAFSVECGGARSEEMAVCVV